MLPLLLGVGCSETPRPLPPRDAGTRDAPRPWQFPEAGDLLGPDLAPVKNDLCVGATALAFAAGGTLTHSASTVGARNDFGDAIRCGGTTALSGPQRYYRITLTAGRHYRFTLAPGFSALLYLFTACSKTIINTDCTSGGATGGVVGPIAAGGSGSLDFVPGASGEYVVAVDSKKTSDAGTFTLTVRETQPPQNSRCAAPSALDISSGKATVKASTLGAANDFQKTLTCNLGKEFDGPQLYYKVALTAGSWYRLSLSPQFAGGLWVAGSGANCLAQNINLDCGGVTGTVLPLVDKGKTGSTLFRPLLSADYVVAVDALDPQAAGDFSLTVEKVTPAGNTVCSGATPLSLSGGKVALQGSTAGAENDSGAALRCGTAAPLLGPQAYYAVTLDGGKTYLVSLKAQFSAALALGAACSTLAADCSSGGLSGGYFPAPTGLRRTLRYTPTSGGPHLIAVDSPEPGASGSFELLVQEYSAPQNGACATPKTLTLGSTSPLTELGDTGPLKNDLAGVSCGLSNGPFAGPQAYYRFTPPAAKSVTVTLTPESSFDPALYAFSAATSCSATAVESACTGTASDTVGKGKIETLTLAAGSSDWIVVVDAWSPSETGSYTLTLSW